MSPSESGSSVPPPGCPAHTGEGDRGDHVTDTPKVRGYPLYIPEFTADPWIVYRRLRDFGPVVPVELAPGVSAWLVIGYATALEVLRSPAAFSKDSRRWRAMKEGEVPPDSPMIPILAWQPSALFADGNEHRRLRQPIAESLARVDPGALRDHVERQADRLIRQFADAGEADLVRQYTQALPLRVLGDMCGVPVALSERISDASYRLADGKDAEKALGEMTAALEELVLLKRYRPGDDVTSWMMAHPAALNDDEIVGTLLLLLAYGGGILRTLLSSSLRLLLSDDRFAGDLAGGSLPVDDALNEVLWNDPPLANYAPHFPVRDVKLGGVWLREGDPVFVSLAAANTDPSVVVDNRSGNRAHLAWGAGPHTCPAQHQARQIASVAMETLLERVPDMELAVPVGKLEQNPGPFFRSPATLPVRFPPPPRAMLPAGFGAARPRGVARPGLVPVPRATSAGPGAAVRGAGPVGGEPFAGVLRRTALWLSTWWRGQEQDGRRA